ncbi:MAG: aryl-sulfate sulfotransferase [Planctomycetota bacterium]|nr:aryl-sulfate sulfotransferase [Planctomycetota bacterium]
MLPFAKHACLLPLLLAACTHSGPDPHDPTPIPAPARDRLGSATAQDGYLLITPLKSKKVFLVDREGTTLHQWETEWEPGNSVYLTERGTLYRCMRIEEDVAFSGGGIGGGIQEIAADGTVLWEYRMADGQRHHHHDIEPMPNGNLLLIGWEKRSAEEALANGRDPELLRGEEFWPDALYEIRPFGTDGAEIVWQWHSWDHLIQDFDPEAPHYGVVAEHPERIDINGDRDPELKSEEELDALMDQLAAMGYAGYAGGDDGAPIPPDSAGPPPHDAAPDSQNDGPPTAKELRRKKFRDADWMHTNAIDYNATLDQVAISVRTFDEIWIIDHSTSTAEAASRSGGRRGKGGDLLYRWGNPAAYGMGTLEDRVLIGQHDVQWIEDGQLGAGGLMVFNNGEDRPGGDYSSIEEWWPVRNEAGTYLRDADGSFGPAETSWTYTAPEKADFFSSFISGVQRLPNGNTLICSGEPGLLFEVDPAGKIVWEWECDLVSEEQAEGPKGGPVRANSLFRITHLMPEHPGLEALRMQGIGIPLPPP